MTAAATVAHRAQGDGVRNLGARGRFLPRNRNASVPRRTNLTHQVGRRYPYSHRRTGENLLLLFSLRTEHILTAAPSRHQLRASIETGTAHASAPAAWRGDRAAPRGAARRGAPRRRCAAFLGALGAAALSAPHGAQAPLLVAPGCAAGFGGQHLPAPSEGEPAGGLGSRIAAARRVALCRFGAAPLALVGVRGLSAPRKNATPRRGCGGAAAIKATRRATFA